MPVYSYDKTVASVPVVGVNHRALHLNSFSEAGEFINYPDILEQNKLTGSRRLMMKIDIEGAEFDFFHSVQPAHLKDVAVLVVELHMLSLTRFSFFQAMCMSLLNKFLATHFVCHTHLNNVGSLARCRGHDVPRVVEVTFLNRAHYKPLEARNPWLHVLDAVDIPNRPAVHYRGQFY